jgi:hypothetical protein
MLAFAFALNFDLFNAAVWNGGRLEGLQIEIFFGFLGREGLKGFKCDVGEGLFCRMAGAWSGEVRSVERAVLCA